MNQLFTKNRISLTKKLNKFCQFSSSAKTWDYDIIVNGGGIVGASFVANICKLSQSNLKICILDPGITTMPTIEAANKPIPEIRTYALSPRSIQFLKDIHAWEYMNQRYQPYESMQVWERYGPGMLRFHAKEIDHSSLGCIVEDNAVLASIYHSLEQHYNVPEKVIDYKFGVSLTGHHVSKPHQGMSTNGPIEVTLSNKEKITGRLLVGADGNMSITRRLANIQTYGWSYGQEAVVCTIKLKVSPQGDYNGTTAYQRYLPTGPIAILPLWDGYASIVWTLPINEAKRVMSLPQEEIVAMMNNIFQSNEEATLIDHALHKLPFNGLLSQAYQSFLSATKVIDPLCRPPEIEAIQSKLLSFPLQFQHVNKYISSRIALIGDAAHSIHPQAGQGLNLGLMDAECLSRQVVTQGCNNGVDYGNSDFLQGYHDERYKANLGMMTSVDTINRFFSSNQFTVQDSIESKNGMEEILSSKIQTCKASIRSLGMLGIHSFPPIKAHLVKVATGL